MLRARVAIAGHARRVSIDPDWIATVYGTVATALTSSTLKTVGKLPSVVPRKLIRMTCPLKGVRSNVLCT